MEPQAVNTLVEEAEKLKELAVVQLDGKIPATMEHLFEVTSSFFQDEVIAEWRLQERFDELIDYILYQYGSHGGEDLWSQVLLDLRLKKEEVKALALLEGLLPGRLSYIKKYSKNVKKYPDNYLAKAKLGIVKGEALKVLYEHAFLLENKPPETVDTSKTKPIKDKILDVLST